MFLKFKCDKNFSHIFSYVEQMAKVAKHLCISERPVILTIGELTRFMNEVRSSGKDLGFLYLEQGPLVQLLGPRKVRDQLAYRQLPSLPLPLPTVNELLKDMAVSSQDRETISSNLLEVEERLKEHMRELSNKLGNFMDTISSGVN